MVAVSNIWLKETGQTFAVKNDATELPTKYFLEQNFPNPFNPSTTIKFDLPEQGMVNLIVYDIVGRKVAELLNESKDAGVHVVSYDGSNLASGLYFYRLQAGKYSQVKRMLLLK